MFKLQAHSSNKPNNFSVTVSYKIIDDKLQVDFKVIKDSLHISEEFDPESWDNWGLWNFDVVEVFVTKNKNSNQYLEVQSSAHDQKFALNIFEPRKDFEKVSLEKTQVKSIKDEFGFSSSFKIDLAEIPGEEAELYGNFHACLHLNGETYFFSLNPNHEAVADFHRPDLFVELERSYV